MQREQLAASQRSSMQRAQRGKRLWLHLIACGLPFLASIGPLTPAFAEGETIWDPPVPAPALQVPQGLIPTHATPNAALVQGRSTQIQPKKAVRAKAKFTATKVELKTSGKGKTTIAAGKVRPRKLVSEQAKPAPTQLQPRAKNHRVVIQVTQNDPALMNMALNNAENLTKHYEDKGEKVDIEFVAYGPGLHMVRSDTSPVKPRLTAFKEKMKHVTFSGCGNTMAVQARQENKDIILLPEARVVTTGVARITELQEQGWTYVRP
jgi:uncharacterized protein